MKKLIRITTVPVSLENLLEGQLNFMQEYYKVTAISAEKDRLLTYGKDNGVKTFHVEMTRKITPFKDLQALMQLYRFFKKEKPDIVHTHTPKAGMLGMMAAKAAGVPVRLHTVAGMPLMEAKGGKRKILEMVEKITYSCAHRIYPNSIGLKEFILKERFAPANKIKVLGKGSSNGIDISYFDPANISKDQKEDLRLSLGIPVNDLVFIFVGRLVRDKGMNELIESFVKLQEEHPNISLLLVGTFEQELDPISVKNKSTLKNHPKIFPTGYQNDVRPYFAISDVLVFPSYREGFPNVVMQAGAMGLPLIVSDINGCNEIVEEGINGTIIPAKKVEELKEAMTKMLLQPNWRQKLQLNSRSKITSSYDRQTFWRLLLEEYKNVSKNKC